MQKIGTAQENYHGAGKLPWYRKITTALRAFLLQKFTVLLLALYQTFAITTKNYLPLSQLAFCTLAIVR